MHAHVHPGITIAGAAHTMGEDGRLAGAHHLIDGRQRGLPIVRMAGAREAGGVGEADAGAGQQPLHLVRPDDRIVPGVIAPGADPSRFGQGQAHLPRLLELSVSFLFLGHIAQDAHQVAVGAQPGIALDPQPAAVLAAQAEGLEHPPPAGGVRSDRLHEFVVVGVDEVEGVVANQFVDAPAGQGLPAAVGRQDDPIIGLHDHEQVLSVLEKPARTERGVRSRSSPLGRFPDGLGHEPSTPHGQALMRF